jgi:hypothetical protein
VWVIIAGMALSGQAKVDYQREYMRCRRGSIVRPKVQDVRPDVRPKVKPQSYNSMMVGYVPPKG